MLSKVDDICSKCDENQNKEKELLTSWCHTRSLSVTYFVVSADIASTFSFVTSMRRLFRSRAQVAICLGAITWAARAPLPLELYLSLQPHMKHSAIPKQYILLVVSIYFWWRFCYKHNTDQGFLHCDWKGYFFIGWGVAASKSSVGLQLPGLHGLI